MKLGVARKLAAPFHWRSRCLGSCRKSRRSGQFFREVTHNASLVCRRILRRLGDLPHAGADGRPHDIDGRHIHGQHFHDLSQNPARRRRRQCLRSERGRPVSMAGKRRSPGPGGCRLGRKAERCDRDRSRSSPRARLVDQDADPADRLRTLRHSDTRWREVLLQLQSRPAEPGPAIRAGWLERGRSPADRSEQMGRRWCDRAVGVRTVHQWQVSRL